MQLIDILGALAAWRDAWHPTLTIELTFNTKWLDLRCRWMAQDEPHILTQRFGLHVLKQSRADLLQSFLVAVDFAIIASHAVNLREADVGEGLHADVVPPRDADPA